MLVDDYFCSRRLVQVMEANLRPLGFHFVKWSTRGNDVGDEAFEFTYLTSNGKKEVTTGISRRELLTSKHSIKTIAGVLSQRVVKRVEAESRPPPSPP